MSCPMQKSAIFCCHLCQGYCIHFVSQDLTETGITTMMTTVCPKCDSKAFKRNGFTRHGKQNHRCLDCGRQFCVDVIPHSEHVPVNAHLSMIIERIEAQELWSSGTKTRQKQWVWIVLDAHFKQVIAFYVDSEDKNGADEVWKLIPEEFRLHAKIMTDLGDVFRKLLPVSEHHRIVLPPNDK